MAARVGAPSEEVLKARSRGGGVLSPRVQVSEMQRARLLAAAVVAAEELGWSRVTVAGIAARARVSRRTFYDLFGDREDCLLAVCEDTTGRIAAEIAAALAAKGEHLVWRERVRTGLWVILSFFDREPELARFCVVQSARGGRRVLGWREALLTRLTDVIQEGALRRGARGAQVPSLTAEGLIGAVLAILHRRLCGSEREPLTGLLGALMSLIVLPYQGPAAARSESTRPAPLPVPATLSAPTSTRAYRAGQDPLAEVPMRLTYRTARVLQAAVEHPGASNRTLGEQADIHDQGQISKLLTRLENLGLLANTGQGHAKGEPNAWHLTHLGKNITQQLSLSTEPPQGPGMTPVPSTQPTTTPKTKRSHR
jgi:AcrR family transcriptional regulator/DNA-binding MarR family transcriptional regulator